MFFNFYRTKNDAWKKMFRVHLLRTKDYVALQTMLSSQKTFQISGLLLNFFFFKVLESECKSLSMVWPCLPLGYTVSPLTLHRNTHWKTHPRIHAMVIFDIKWFVFIIRHIFVHICIHTCILNVLFMPTYCIFYTCLCSPYAYMYHKNVTIKVVSITC